MMLPVLSLVIIASCIIISMGDEGLLTRHDTAFSWEDLHHVLIALDKGPEYIDNAIEDVNLDAIIGTREVQGESCFILPRICINDDLNGHQYHYYITG